MCIIIHFLFQVLGTKNAFVNNLLYIILLYYFILSYLLNFIINIE